MKRNQLCRIAISIVIFSATLLLFLVSACSTNIKPAPQVDSYLLDYTRPSFNISSPIPDSVKIQRFAIANAYNTKDMIFRRAEYDIDAFNYNRWAVNPADMVADMLLRDMRSSRFFHAVFSRYSIDEGRFAVEGGVESFLLRIEKDRATAVIALSIMLKDNTEKHPVKRILFQKNYAAEEPLAAISPVNYCRAASIAMERLSRQILNDIYLAAEQRI